MEVEFANNFKKHTERLKTRVLIVGDNGSIASAINSVADFALIPSVNLAHKKFHKDH